MKFSLATYRKYLNVFIAIISIGAFENCHEKSDLSKSSLDPKQELGHHLFFETQISINHTKSCASCHSPEFAFTDGYRRSITALGENVMHNAPSLINASKLKVLDWANPEAISLAKQIKRPLYNTHPIELGLDQHLTELQQFFKNDSLYAQLFKKAFPTTDSLYTLSQIEECLVAYESLLQSENSAFDRHKMSASAERGNALFRSEELKCVSCHPPPDFTLATTSNRVDEIFANTGLYNVDNKNQYPLKDEGLYEYTKKENDRGKYRIPSLRNVFLTPPYMHDGSVATIEEVIDIYARGGRVIDYGEHKGDGSLNQYKDKRLQGFTLSNSDKIDLINFLDALSDTTIKSNLLFMKPR